MKEAIDLISTWLARATKSNRGRTEVRASDLQDVLDLLLDVQAIENPQVPTEVYEKNQCRFGDCEEEVLTPIYYKAGDEWFKEKNLPYDGTYKTLGRAYCSSHLEEFDTGNGLLPKIITDNIEKVYEAGYNSMKELGFGDSIPLVVYHNKKASGDRWLNRDLYAVPKIVISHNGRQQKKGKHGVYLDELNKITIFIKKVESYSELLHIFVHEMTHYFLKEIEKEVHGDEFNAVLELMADKLGYDFRGETPAFADSMRVKV